MIKITKNIIRMLNHYGISKIKATILVVTLPKIVAFYVHLPSVSSPLLLRISPKTFAFIPILPMWLSSLNGSISKAFRHIMPYYAPVCKGMHYHKTGVPWQMKSTLIIFSIFSFYLNRRLNLINQSNIRRQPFYRI